MGDRGHVERSAAPLAECTAYHRAPDSPVHQIDLIKRIVRNVVVGREQILITVATDNLAAELLGDDARAGDPPSEREPLDDHVIRFSAQLKRCRIETRLVVPTQISAAALPHTTTVHAFGRP